MMSAPSNKERSDKDLADFEKQPGTVKELQRLKDLAEKSTGTQRADLDKKIRRRAEDPDSSG